MSITAENRAAIQSAYGYCCGYCGVSEIDIGGWFHIRWLHLNRPQLILWRQNQQRIRELKEALAQSQAMTQRLQERIRELEREAAELRARVARLTGSE